MSKPINKETISELMEDIARLKDHLWSVNQTMQTLEKDWGLTFGLEWVSAEIRHHETVSHKIVLTPTIPIDIR